MRKEYSVTFVLTFFNAAGQESLENIMKTLKFDGN